MDANDICFLTVIFVWKKPSNTLVFLLARKEWNCASIYDTLEFDCLTTKSTFWTVDTVLKKDPIINPPGSNTGHLKGSSGVEWPGLHNREHRATQLSTKIRSLLLVYDLVMVNQSSQLYNESTGGQKVAKDNTDHRA